jgi:hypothetical protein
MYPRGENKVDYFLAVDDGRAVRVRAWRVSQEIYEQFEENTVVRAHVYPGLGHVSSLELVRAPSFVAGTPATMPETEVRTQVIKFGFLIPGKPGAAASQPSPLAAGLEPQPDVPPS